MILKVTLFGLILLLIAVISASYYANKEGFDNLPVPTSVTAPIATPVTAPIATSVTAPIATPVTAPIATPVTAPIATPVTAPVKAAVLPIAQVPQVPKGQQGQVAPRDTSPLASLMPHNMTYTPTITPQSSVTPQRTDVQAQVEISDTGYNAMSLQQKSNLLKTIQQMVKNEVLATRSTQPIDSDDDCSSASASEAQGNEYNHKTKKDMSQYIKKDSIPCAGCTLDY
uniref:Uncharacterized protein n=1 Tax=viral metagenome TaxID=1070528 RepID=A0A6C0II65_9ZZZZ